ncbi:hypothetical protein BC830DRAFT_1257043 [Chytriomyces sp. MP71]|nr:hypothetical protein BC830DRAFT_1257043 [Chytriomyces sp. MP71]
MSSSPAPAGKKSGAILGGFFHRRDKSDKVSASKGSMKSPTSIASAYTTAQSSPAPPSKPSKTPVSTVVSIPVEISTPAVPVIATTALPATPPPPAILSPPKSFADAVKRPVPRSPTPVTPLPKVGVKVIGAGLPRTGTVSLKLALERLGFKTYAEPTHHSLWMQGPHGDDWGIILDEFDAALDFPAALHYRELLKQNPGAMVILTVRNADKWYEAVKETLYDAPRVPFYFAWMPFFWGMNPATSRLASKLLWDGFFEGRFADKEYAVARYKRHNDEVRASVPAKRLLELNVDEGWAPLCKFLGVSIPDVEFPKVKVVAEAKKRNCRVRNTIYAANFVLLGASVAVGLSLFQKYSRK